jgi:hypothetical protein
LALLVSLNFGVQKHAMSSQFEVLQVLFENCTGKLCAQLAIIIFFALSILIFWMIAKSYPESV